MYEFNCPWTLATEKQSVSLGIFKRFLASIIDSYTLCVHMLITIGFGIMRCDLSLKHINITFFMTIFRFLLI